MSSPGSVMTLVPSRATFSPELASYLMVTRPQSDYTSYERDTERGELLELHDIGVSSVTMRSHVLESGAEMCFEHDIIFQTLPEGLQDIVNQILRRIHTQIYRNDVYQIRGLSAEEHEMRGMLNAHDCIRGVLGDDTEELEIHYDLEGTGEVLHCGRCRPCMLGRIISDEKMVQSLLVCAVVPMGNARNVDFDLIEALKIAIRATTRIVALLDPKEEVEKIVGKAKYVLERLGRWECGLFLDSRPPQAAGRPSSRNPGALAPAFGHGNPFA